MYIYIYVCWGVELSDTVLILWRRNGVISRKSLCGE